MIKTVVPFVYRDLAAMASRSDTDYVFTLNNALYRVQNRVVSEMTFVTKIIDVEPCTHIAIYGDLIYLHNRAKVYELSVDWSTNTIRSTTLFHEVPGSDIVIDNIFYVENKLLIALLFPSTGMHRFVYKYLPSAGASPVLYEDTYNVWYPGRTLVYNEMRGIAYLAGPHTRGTLNREIRYLPMTKTPGPMKWEILRTMPYAVESFTELPKHVVVATRYGIHVYDKASFFDNPTLPPPVVENQYPFTLAINENVYVYQNETSIVCAVVDRAAKTTRLFIEYDVQTFAFKPQITGYTNLDGATTALPFVSLYGSFYGNRGLHISSSIGVITHGVKSELAQIRTLEACAQEIKQKIIEETNNFNQTFYEVEFVGYRASISEIKDFDNPPFIVKEIGVFNKETNKARFVRYVCDTSESTDQKVISVKELKTTLASSYRSSVGKDVPVLDGITTLSANLHFFRSQLKMFDTKASFERHVMQAWGYRSAATDGKILKTILKEE